MEILTEPQAVSLIWGYLAENLPIEHRQLQEHRSRDEIVATVAAQMIQAHAEVMAERALPTPTHGMQSWHRLTPDEVTPAVVAEECCQGWGQLMEWEFPYRDIDQQPGVVLSVTTAAALAARGSRSPR